MIVRYLFVICILIPGIIWAHDLETIKKTGQLTAAFTKKSYDGIHRELALAFADHLNVDLVTKIIPWKDVFCISGHFPEEVISNPTVAYDPDIFNDCDIICNSISILPWRQKLMNFVSAFKVTELLLSPKNNRFTHYEDLKNKRITFLENTTFETHIQRINEQIGGGITMMPMRTTQECYQNVLEQKADALILDSDNALLFMKKQSGFEISFPVGPIMKCGWGIQKSNIHLQKELQNFFDGLIGTTEMNAFFVKYFGVNHETYDKIVQAHSQHAQVERKWKRELEDIISSKKLIIGVRERPFVYKKNGPAQFNHALAVAFARELDVEPVLKIIPTFSDYWKNDQNIIDKETAYTPKMFRHFDIACDVIEPLTWRQSKVDILSFFPLVQTVIARKDTPIHYIDDLYDFQGVTSKSSTYEEILHHHGINQYHYAKVADFIQEIITKKADYAIVENGFFYTHNIPQIEVKFVIGKITERGWAIKKNHPRLKHKLYEFFEKASTSGLMDRLLVDQTGISFKEMTKFTQRFHWKYQVGKFSFVNYSKSDGLPQEPVLSIFQDHDDMMWFGTAGGLIRYNGRQMKMIDATDGLSGNVILSINQDSTRALYLGTDNGMSIIDDAQIKSIANGVVIRKIVIDHHDNKWLLGNEIYLYTKDKQLIAVNEQLPQLKEIIWDIALQENQSGVYLGTANGVYELDTGFQLKQINQVPCHALSSGADGYLWMASKDKIFVDTQKELIIANDRLGIENTHINKIEQLKEGSLFMISDSKVIEIVSLNQNAIIYDTHVGILPSSLLSFFQDNENNYWIGFMGNIQKLTNVSLRAFYPDIFNGEINHIFQDHKKRMWLSGSHGIYCYKDTIVDVTPRLNIAERKCMALPYGNQVLVANISGLYLLNASMDIVRKIRFTQPIFHLLNMFVSEQKELFLMTSRQIVYYKNLDSPPKVFNDKQTHLAQTLISHEGQIIGGNADGLIRFDGRTFVQHARLNVHVRTLFSHDHRLWVGTDKGLGLYENNQLVIPDHLKNKLVYAIASNSQGENLYLGTDNGFSSFNPDSFEIEYSMDQRDGMPVNRVSNNALFVDAENLLWIGTYRGVSIFDATRRPLIKFKPKCHIEEIYINGRNITPQVQVVYPNTPLTLSWDQNNIMFSLVGLSFKDEKSIRYDYYMRGLENYTTETNNVSASVLYQNLAPGHYDFHFRAKGKDNIWNAYQSFSFNIQRPFWQTIPFYIIVIIAFLGLAWTCMMAYARIRLKQSQKRAQILKNKVKERTFQLEKMNQELTQINAEQNRFFTIISQDLRNPFSAVIGLADLLKSYYDMLDDAEKRGYIDEIHNTIALLNKILDNLHQWSGIQSGRLGTGASTFHLLDIIQEHLQIVEQAAQKKQIRIDNQVDRDIKIHADANLLIILIENLLSNAIKYSRQDSCIKISANTDSKSVELNIIDEGVGIPDTHLDKLLCIEHYHVTPGTANEKGTGLGLLICKVIVDKHEGSIDIQSEKDKGTRVIVTLPNMDKMDH